MGIDAIHHMIITYLSMSETFLFQEDIIGQHEFRKADLMIVHKITITERTLVPGKKAYANGSRIEISYNNG
jgi:hypothetical protein